VHHAVAILAQGCIFDQLWPAGCNGTLLAQEENGKGKEKGKANTLLAQEKQRKRTRKITKEKLYSIRRKVKGKEKGKANTLLVQGNNCCLSESTLVCLLLLLFVLAAVAVACCCFFFSVVLSFGGCSWCWCCLLFGWGRTHFQCIVIGRHLQQLWLVCLTQPCAVVVAAAAGVCAVQWVVLL